MTLLYVMPVIAYALVAAVLVRIATGPSAPGGRGWLWPAGIGLLFLAVTVVTVLGGGLLPFWRNHTTNLAGNQVWFDLLIAVAIGFYLLAPRARAQGMPLLPWAIAVLLTASVALLPMLARVLWLESRSGRAGG